MEAAVETEVETAVETEAVVENLNAAEVEAVAAVGADVKAVDVARVIK